MTKQIKPSEQQGMDTTWYSDWEVGWEEIRKYYTGRGWTAYKGGADLDAKCVDGVTFQKCLDEIDEAEDL